MGTLTENQQLVMNSLMNNAMLSRGKFLNELFDQGRDYNKSCRYPDNISIDEYKLMSEREGLGERVYKVYAEESWKRPPKVYEIEDEGTETAFEEAINEMLVDLNVWYYLQKADELSGIGQFGILLLGFSDGKGLENPVIDYDRMGKPGKSPKKVELMYLRALDQSLVDISKYETDANNKRYGQPLEYTIKLGDLSEASVASMTAPPVLPTTVHWTRVVHFADNCRSSEVLGTPRMKAVYNRLMDLRKIYAGSGEMFWQGGFPGYTFEVDPELGPVDLDKDALREEFANFANSMQRYMAVEGVTVRSLAPQVADPAPHVRTQLENIAITLAVPLRVLMGTERGELASSQDSRTWNDRLRKRCETYLSPRIVRPFIQRLIDVGALPPLEANNRFKVEWPDLEAPSEQDQATVAKAFTEAMAQYVSNGVDALVPPLEYMVTFLRLPREVAEAIILASAAHIAEVQEEFDTVAQDTQKGFDKRMQGATKNPTTGEVMPPPEPPAPTAPPKSAFKTTA